MASSGLKVGIIGVGFGATVHAPAFQAEGWDVQAICARTSGSAEKAAAELGIPNAYTDWHKLIASDVDVVAVVTPPIAHTEPTLAAIEAGKHVLCEKPFAMNIDEAKAMRDAAKVKGVTAMIAHEFRYTPQRLYVKELLAEGYVGEPKTVFVEADFNLGRGSSGPAPMAWQADAATGGGQLGAIGSHFLDSLRWWLGEVTSIKASLAIVRPERVDPATGKVVQADAEDTFTINMGFANGTVGSFAYTSAAPVHLGARVLIQGTEGTLMTPQPGVNPTSDGVVMGAKVGATELAELPMPERCTPLKDDRDRRIPAFRLLLRDFERGIREGMSPTPNFDDGVHAQAVMDAVRESARTGATVRLG